MLGYRTGETPVVQVHVKKPKPFKWLRKLFRRIKFKHARFDDGKYARGQKDIEKWNEDTPLAKADYPDHRWQVVTRSRSRRGRSKNRDLQSPIQSKPKQNGETQEENKNQNNHSNKFMNMDALKHVLDNDRPNVCSFDEPSSTGNRPTIRAEVHPSPSGRNGCKGNVSRAARSEEGSIRSPFSGYNELDVELSPVPCINNTGKRVNMGKDNSYSPHPSTISSLTSAEKGGHHKHSAVSKTQFKGQSVQNLNDSLTQDHDNENDINHMRVFEKRRFNKKPKNRKGKKRRLRRKGKYVELETAPSCESLDDVQEVVGGQMSSCHNETVKQQLEHTIAPNPLRSLVLGLRNLSDAPVFHPAKYKGYTRFFDE